MSPPPPKKPSKGRRKIEIKRIDDRSARGATFSKRRVGIFRKATELSTLCGAQIAMIVFSICGKAFSFGYPNIESVLMQFFTQSRAESHQTTPNLVSEGAVTQMLKDQCDQINQEFESKKTQRIELYGKLDISPFRVSLEHLSQLDLATLRMLKGKMEILHADLRREISRSKTVDFMGVANINQINADVEATPQARLNAGRFELVNNEIRRGGAMFDAMRRHVIFPLFGHCGTDTTRGKIDLAKVSMDDGDASSWLTL